MVSKFMAGFTRLVLMSAVAVAFLGAVIGCFKFPVVGILVVVGGIYHRFHHRDSGSGDSHGTARLADMQDAAAGGLLSNSGLILGRSRYLAPTTRKRALRWLLSPSVPSRLACKFWLGSLLGSRWSRNSLVRIRNFVHLATFAPTGKGKGVSVVIPNLLSYEGSCVVVDMKGELATHTAEARRRMGHKVVILDPWGITGMRSDSFNFLDGIDENSWELFDDIRLLAGLMVHRTGKESDPYWNDAAEIVIASILVFVCSWSKPGDRNLETFRNIVSSRGGYKQAMEVMSQLGDVARGVVQKLGHMLSWHVDKELSSILSSVHRHTMWLDSPILAAQMQHTSFNPSELRTGRMTIYLVLPHDKITEYSALLRMWVGSLMRSIVKAGPSEESPVLFFLDEAAQMGRMKILEDAVSLYRGFGIRLWFFFQSIADIQNCYGEKAQVFLDNIDVQQFFGTAAYDSADYISKRCGDETITLCSRNRNSTSTSSSGDGKGSSSYTSGSGVSYSETGRRLFFPQEILNLPKDVSLVFSGNLPVLPVQLLRYYDAPEFRSGPPGSSKGLGIGSGLMACLMLALSLVFAGVMAAIPVQLPLPQPNAARTSGSMNGRDFGPPPSARTRRYSNSQRRYRQPSPSPYQSDFYFDESWGW